jgi:hypothetical protein
LTAPIAPSTIKLISTKDRDKTGWDWPLRTLRDPAMKTLTLSIGLVFMLVCLCESLPAGEDSPGRLVRLDTNHPPPGKPWTVLTRVGDLIQLSVRCRTFAKDNLRALKVEITGDAVRNVGVVEVPVLLSAGPLGPITVDNTWKDLSCFLTAAKVGRASVAITPVGQDGKNRPTRSLVVCVSQPERAGEDVPGRLVHRDTNHPPPGKPWTVLTRVGDLIQLSVRCRTSAKDNLRALKVEITGDAVANVAVAEVPVLLPANPLGPPTVDTTWKDLSWFLTAAKVGRATVAITPVGEDGKDRPTRKLVISVAERKCLP